jgi:tol-pal system protein YbgF
MSAALCACATDQVSRAEHQELLASLRALRAENGRIEARLDKLEADAKVAAAQTPRPATPVTSKRGPEAPVVKEPPNEMPALTVVKLKPKKEAPPRLATEVEVVEPAEAVITNVSDGGDELKPEADEALVEQQYQAGLDALKTGNPEGGVAQLQQFAKDWPRHPRADNALYYAAVGLMAAREFKDAENVLEAAIRQYPAGDATVDSLLKLAECRARLNRHADARATWEKIVSTYPGTQAASTAQARLTASTASRKD